MILKAKIYERSHYIQVIKMKKHYTTFLLCAVLIMACATSPTGRRQLMLVSEDSAIAASKQAYVEMLKP